MESKLTYIVNKDKVTVSVPNPLPIPVPTKDVTAYKNKEDFSVDKERFVTETKAYGDMQESLIKYPLKGSICKSGIFIKADILAYHIGDKREGELHEDNTITLYGPYK